MPQPQGLPAPAQHQHPPKARTSTPQKSSPAPSRPSVPAGGQKRVTVVSPPKEKKKKVELAVDTGQKPAGDDLTSSEVELMESGELTMQQQRRRSSVQIYDDTDVTQAARHGFISAPCDCFLSIWAVLGEAIEGGAEQIVGLVLLPMTAFVYYLVGQFLGEPGSGVGGIGGIGQGLRLGTARTDDDGGSAHEDLLDKIASSHPIFYLATDLGGLFLIAILVLFEGDLHRLYRELRMRLRGYRAMNEVAETPALHRTHSGFANVVGSRPVGMMRDKTLKRELHRAIDATEELQMKMMVRRSSRDGSEVSVDGRDGGRGVVEAAKSPDDVEEEEDKAVQLLKQYQKYKGRLKTALSKHYSSKFNLSPEKKPRRRHSQTESCTERFMQSNLLKVFKRSLNGLVTVWLYFADVISDIEVMLLLYSAGLVQSASIAFVLLFLQFIFIWQRVLPYLQSTFGADSAIHNFFLWFGFPFGMIGLDFLMFLEPFGLLPIVPMPDSMRQFIPAYKSTRIISEVLIESLPQCLLQSYIFVTVMQHLRLGTLSAAEKVLLGASIEGSTFIHILPRSIAISTITSLKAWIELVLSAREAGISVRTKFGYLLAVGDGLPLDALIRGTIIRWHCTYHLADGEVPPLLDALTKNSSLVRLNLTSAGLDWAGPEARAERSGMPLIEAMHEDPRCLAELKTLIVLRKPKHADAYHIPVSRLRASASEALAALREEPGLLEPGGARRLEILLMADLLRKNRRTTAVKADDVKVSTDAVFALMQDIRGGKVSMQEWRLRVTQMMVEGNTRRAHMKTLLSAEALRDVGFGVASLLAVDYPLTELREGGFTAGEMLAVKVEPHTLLELGYSPTEMRAGGLRASHMMSLHVTATQCREAGYSAEELKLARYPLTQLRSAEYPVAELCPALFAVSEMHEAGFPALPLRELVRSKAITTASMREAGYTAAELKHGGFEVKRLLAAGYDAKEVTEAGWSLDQLRAAGYEAKELRRAHHTASAMRAAGFEIEHLKRAGYTPAELQSAGYDASTLKEEGVGLFALKQANTPVADLRAAGYKADRLKLQGYTCAELASGGYTAAELRGFRDSLYVDQSTKYGEVYAGYTAKELRDAKVGFGAEELRQGGYLPKELREGGYTAAELRRKGFTCAELHTGGYAPLDLIGGGFATADLRAVGHSAETLRAIGLEAAELKAVGYSVPELRKGGFEAEELVTAGTSPKELKQGGFTAAQLRQIGQGVRELKALGYGAKELHKAGFRAKELAAHGFDREELREGGYPRREVEAVTGKGRTPAPAVDELYVRGYAARELRDIGFGAADLRGSGFTCKDIKEGGYSDEDLLQAGFKPRSVEAVDGRENGADGYTEGVWVQTLREKSYACKELRGIGFGAAALVEGGYPPKELRDVGFSIDELKEAGCTAGSLREAGFTSKQLFAAGFTLRHLREGGAPWKELVIFLRATHAELVKAGFEGIDPKDKVFKEYRPEDRT